jgi:hypothetical protein
MFVGNLCTSADCFEQNLEASRLEEGDLIVIPNLESLLSDDGGTGALEWERYKINRLQRAWKMF